MAQRVLLLKRGVMKPYLIAILLGSAACGGGSAYDDAVDDVCSTFVDCGGLFASEAQCHDFYDKVYDDLEARCDDPGPIQDAYARNLDCITAAIDANDCAAVFSACQSERAAYEALRDADNESCEPDDD